MLPVFGALICAVGAEVDSEHLDRRYDIDDGRGINTWVVVDLTSQRVGIIAIYQFGEPKLQPCMLPALTVTIVEAEDERRASSILLC